MKNLSVARRYAKALLLIGKDDGNAETYRHELNGFASLMGGYADLEEAICNPLYGAEGRKEVLRIVIEKADLSYVMRSFLMLLFDKGRIAFVEDINRFYQDMADELKGIARASLVSATELPDYTVEKIRTSLGQLTGKEVRLDVQQDPDLIGGIVTKIGDLVLDGSVRTQLHNMRESLKRGESV